MIVVVFRNRFVEGIDREKFGRLDDEMWEIVSKMDGFISSRSYTAEDGERLTIVEFENEEALEAWRNNESHQAAQKAGREEFYEYYSSHVCKEVRRSEFVRR